MKVDGGLEDDGEIRGAGVGWGRRGKRGCSGLWDSLK